ncbi:MAG: hypothetical protein ABEJ95_04000 [Candidatus Nanohalobium sp.]
MGIEENIEDARGRVEEDDMDDLRSRLESLELEFQNREIHDRAAQKRIERVERSLEDIDSCEDLEQRIEEVERQLVDLSRGVDERIDKSVENQVRELRDDVDDVKNDMEKLASAVMEISDMLSR